MKVASLLFIGICSGFLAVNVSAQPTCFTNYDSDSYCEFSGSKLIVIGRVESLTPDSEFSLLRYKAAKVNVLRNVKGLTPGMIALDLPSMCAGSIEKGAVYIFNVDPGRDGTLTTRTWSRLDGLPVDSIDRALEGLDAVVAGQRQPALIGKVERPDGKPFENIKVTATNGSALYTSTTDPGGSFRFNELPNGDYKVSLRYPLGYGPSDDYQTPRTTDERQLTVRMTDDWRCGSKMYFGTGLTARITGTFGGHSPDQPPFFELIDLSTIRSGGSDIEGAMSYSYPETDAPPGRTAFKFFHVVPGRYVLRFGLDRSWKSLTSLYYPGVRSIKDAKVIEIGLGTELNLDFGVEGFSTVTISGRMQLPNGSPLFGGVSLVDAESPAVSDSFSPYDRNLDDIKFVFKTLRGRPAYLCAAYDGTKAGREIHLYTRRNLDTLSDHEDLLLTLDTPIPRGVLWWEKCASDR